MIFKEIIVGRTIKLGDTVELTVLDVNAEKAYLRIDKLGIVHEKHYNIGEEIALEANLELTIIGYEERWMRECGKDIKKNMVKFRVDAPESDSDTYYMLADTGSTGTYADWFYEDEDENICNAVDDDNVFEVVEDEDGDWVEVD